MRITPPLWQVAGSCRFDVVCSTCAASCEEIPETVTVINNDSVPVCEAVRTLPDRHMIVARTEAFSFWTWS